MMSVFTNYLSPYYEMGLLPKVEKPSDIYDQLRIAYNQGSVGVANTTRMVTLFNDDEDSYDIIEAIWSEPRLAYWLRWVNRKITLEIGIQSYQTLDVRLRIATSMLYGLVDKGYINKYVAARIHMNLCKNLRNENILVVNENLPFLGSPLRYGLIQATHYGVNVHGWRSIRNQILYGGVRVSTAPQYSTVCYRSDTLITG